jgi:hypothetical protein
MPVRRVLGHGTPESVSADHTSRAARQQAAWRPSQSATRVSPLLRVGSCFALNPALEGRVLAPFRRATAASRPFPSLFHPRASSRACCRTCAPRRPGRRTRVPAPRRRRAGRPRETRASLARRPAWYGRTRRTPAIAAVPRYSGNVGCGTRRFRQMDLLPSRLAQHKVAK